MLGQTNSTPLWQTLEPGAWRTGSTAAPVAVEMARVIGPTRTIMVLPRVVPAARDNDLPVLGHAGEPEAFGDSGGVVEMNLAAAALRQHAEMAAEAWCRVLNERQVPTPQNRVPGPTHRNTGDGENWHARGHARPDPRASNR